MEIKLLLTIKEIEEERLETIKGLPEKHGLEDISAVEGRYVNPIGYREAFHTSFIFHENVEHYLCEHPCIVLDDEAYRLARVAGELLFELYQRLGRLDYDKNKEQP